MSALSCSTVWALAVASVTWACCWIQTACCCCVAICKTRSSCVICSTKCCLTDDQNSAWHSHTSFLRLDGGRTSKHDELAQTQNHVHDQKSSSCYKSAVDDNGGSRCATFIVRDKMTKETSILTTGWEQQDKKRCTVRKVQQLHYRVQSQDCFCM